MTTTPLYRQFFFTTIHGQILQIQGRLQKGLFEKAFSLCTFFSNHNVPRNFMNLQYDSFQFTELWQKLSQISSIFELQKCNTPQNKDNLIRHSIVLSLAGLAVIVIGYI